MAVDLAGVDLEDLGWAAVEDSEAAERAVVGNEDHTWSG